jgi:geranylgeranyl pyrophosphate synthase
MASETTEEVIARLGFVEEIGRLKAAIATWIEQANAEMRDALEWQFQGSSKYFRPLTVFSCYRAVYEDPMPPELIRSACVVELFHNVTLIIDDILDHSETRRGKKTLHCQFGELKALMVSGYIVAEGYRIIQKDSYDIRLFSELLTRLGVAECMQWRLRQQPLGVEDWRKIAGEDTGSMFEVCACLGTRTEKLRQFGHLLGILYHGCDDVGDISGAAALGGGGNEDLRDGILTLPAAFAIQNPEIRDLFCHAPEQHQERLVQAFQATLPAAEAYLDTVAEEAKQEARLFAANSHPLFTLVDDTRQLSKR